VPRDYGLRANPLRRTRDVLERHFRPIDPVQVRAADVLLLHAGRDQLHLAIVTECGFIHADARSRRVLETPGDPPWPIAGAYRFKGLGELGS
jgi:hypothetical protein